MSFDTERKTQESDDSAASATKFRRYRSHRNRRPFIWSGKYTVHKLYPFMSPYFAFILFFAFLNIYYLLNSRICNRKWQHYLHSYHSLIAHHIVIRSIRYANPLHQYRQTFICRLLLWLRQQMLTMWTTKVLNSFKSQRLKSAPFEVICDAKVLIPSNRFIRICKRFGKIVWIRFKWIHSGLYSTISYWSMFLFFILQSHWTTEKHSNCEIIIRSATVCASFRFETNNGRRFFGR